MQFIGGIISIPWCIKPVFGNIIDRLIKLLKKTKYILFITATSRCILYFILSEHRLSAFPFYLIIFCISMCGLFENIVSEYILVLETKRLKELYPDK